MIAQKYKLIKCTPSRSIYRIVVILLVLSLSSNALLVIYQVTYANSENLYVKHQDEMSFSCSNWGMVVTIYGDIVRTSDWTGGQYWAAGSSRMVRAYGWPLRWFFFARRHEDLVWFTESKKPVFFTVAVDSGPSRLEIVWFSLFVSAGIHMALWTILLCSVFVFVCLGRIRRTRNNKCPRCGYFHGGVSQICSECGHNITKIVFFRGCPKAS